MRSRKPLEEKYLSSGYKNYLKNYDLHERAKKGIISTYHNPTYQEIKQKTTIRNFQAIFFAGLTLGLVISAILSGIIFFVYLYNYELIGAVIALTAAIVYFLLASIAACYL